MYTTTHYTTAATKKRASIVQAAMYATLNAQLQSYNTAHNTNYVLQTNIANSTCNTCYVVNFAIVLSCYNTAVALFNSTVQAFYKRKCTSYYANSYVLCNATQTQAY